MKRQMRHTRNYKVRLAPLFYACLISASVNAEDDPALAWYKRDSTSPYTQEQLQERLLQIRGEQIKIDTHETVISIFVDKRHRAEILGRIRDDRIPPLFRYRELLDLFADSLDHDSLRALGEYQDLQGWVSIEMLELYAPVFDYDQLAVYLYTPAHAKDEKLIELLPQIYPDLSRARSPDDFSAYLNTFNQFTYSDSASHYRLDLEGAIRWHPWVLEGTAYIDPEDEHAFNYNNVRLVRDWPDCPSRLVIGETRSFYPRILASDSIQGIRYSTEFNLQPYVLTEPISEYAFLLERDSNVEVWVNGRPFRTLRLKAGPYDMRNFPLSLGSNNIELRITDDLGRYRMLTFSSIRGPNLLAPGMCDFSYAAGVLGTGREYDNEGLIGANYRRGLTETLTISAEGRADSTHQAAGIGADFATTFCFGRVDAALSHSPYGVGGALQTVMSRYMQGVSISYRFDYYDEHFLYQRQDFWAPRPKYVHDLSLIAPSLGGTGSWRFNAARLHRWNGDSEYRQEVSWNYTYNDRWAFRCIGTHSNIYDDAWSILGQITYHFHDENYRRHHDIQMASDGFRTYSAYGTNPHTSMFDWQLYHTHIKQNDADHTDTIRGTMLYEHARFHTYYAGEIGDFGDRNNTRHMLNFNTALAYVGGQWGFSEPVVDSFAIAIPDENLSKVELIGYCSDYKCSGGQGTPIIIPNLRSYYPGYVRIDSADDCLILDQDPFLLMPHYKSGFLLEVTNGEGEGGLFSVSAHLYDAFGDPLQLQALIITNLTDPYQDPFVSFTNEAGSFRTGGLSAGHRYQVTVGFDAKIMDDSRRFEFVVPADHEGYDEVHLGDILPMDAQVLAPRRPIPELPCPDTLIELWQDTWVPIYNDRPVRPPLRSPLILHTQKGYTPKTKPLEAAKPVQTPLKVQQHMPLKSRPPPFL